MVRSSVSSLLLTVLSSLVVERSFAIRQRGLHPVHKPPGMVEALSTSEDEAFPAVASAEQEEPFPVGVQYCPNYPSLTGYSNWTALATALEQKKENEDSWRDPYYLCPGMVYNAMGITLTISHDFTTIQCADLSAVCVVEQTSIMIKDDLNGIRFEGIDFVKPTGAIVVGKGTHTYFIDSSIQGAVFNENERPQAPIVSYGHLFVIGSRFINNVAHGAIWALDDTLYVDRTKFERNHAVSFLTTGSAIHIGSADPKAIVASTITNSCFVGNEGYHIVMVQGERASVSWTTGNAVDAEAECPGITTAMSETGGSCRPFEILDTSTCDAILLTPAVPTANGTAAPSTNSNQTSKFNTTSTTDVNLADPSRPFNTLTDPVQSAETDGGDALADAVGEVTFTSSTSPLYYGLSWTIVAGAFAIAAILSLVL
jgi:hypothetical protein